MSFRQTSSSSLIRGLLAPAAALVAGGFLIGFGILGKGDLKAAPLQRPHDPDGDGLTNLQESVLGTNPYQADTDGDGFSDLEEFARHSSPLYAGSIPVGQRLRVAMSCSGGDTSLHALIAIYLPHGDLRNKTFRVGLVTGNRCVKLSEQYLLQHGTLAIHAAQDPAARIVTLDLPIQPRLVSAHGDMSLFATVGENLGPVEAADSIHLIAFGSAIVLQVPMGSVQGMLGLTGTGSQTGGSGGAGGTDDIGSIYIPLPVGGDSSGWTAGQVCVQQTELISVTGPQIMQEVVSANCVDGYDGYCPANCSSTVGNTYTTIDPVGLIGG